MEINNWMLGINPDQRDFLMGGDIQIPELPDQDETIIQYNQYIRPITRLACTMVAPIGAISDLFNYQFTDQEIDGVIELAKTRGYVVGYGWWTQAGVKATCDWWNTNHSDKKVVYFRLDLLDKKVLEALAKNYTVVVSYNGNYQYNKDYQEDSILSIKKLDSQFTYGHCTSLRFNKARNMSVIKDSAKGTTYNIYDILYLSDLVKNNVYESMTYLIIPENLLQSKKEDIKRMSRMLLLLKEMVTLTNDIPFQKLCNEKIKYIESQI